MLIKHTADVMMYYYEEPEHYVVVAYEGSRNVYLNEFTDKELASVEFDKQERLHSNLKKDKNEHKR